jgi:dTDP-4-dehydrorhamnose 3,5-epimerase/CDP-3, 6-dideoxy-D-glycero-D-glycero-4-hexulose-5-epimerase
MLQAIELLPGAFHVPLARLADVRGAFVKTHAPSALARLGIHFDLREEFYSLSHRNVIRGMHFQRPPHDHDKIVYCPQGRALDVLLDLRKGAGYGRSCAVLLDAREPALVFIPRGVAHGFKALEDDTLMVYKTSSEHAPTHDAGVRWDSFGFDWDCAAPLTSERDRCHPALGELDSPF